MAEPALRIRGLRAGYGRSEIVRGVDLDIAAGEFACILGPNGAGKSTLLRSVFGLAAQFSGAVSASGVDISRQTPRQVLAAGISYVPQGRSNFPLMTVADNLDLATVTRSDADGVARDIARSYERFPLLAEHRRSIASNLSGGQQRILEIAMALLRRPRVLLIDEPSMGLSPQAIGTVFRELTGLAAEGLTIVLVEQNTRKAIAVTSRTIVLCQGVIAWDGRSATISQDELAELFLPRRDGRLK
ncbi:MAG: ABC transporter ATP-binding protein [Lautropia sp.]